MNVVHFASDFYPNLGGVQEFVRQLAREQRTRGGHPLIITNRWPQTLPGSEMYEGVPVHRVGFRVPERNWRQMTSAALFFIPALLRILRILKMQRTEVIHIQCVGYNAFYALHASRLLRLPLVATLHGELSVDDRHLFQTSAFAQKLLRVVLAEAAAITACSLHTLREAEAFYGKPFGSRGRVIYNGVRNEEFSSAPPYAHPRPYMLAIGRHVRQKGFDLMLRAFNQIFRSGFTDHDLVIAGGGPERDALECLAGLLGIQDHVRFVGSVDRAAAARLFAGCSFFVLPSRLEPLGIVNLEAMAAGKAILATRVGGVPEIVTHERNGLLVEPENVEALADGMIRMISDRDLRSRLGLAGREQARCFDWVGVTEQYDLVYHETQKA